MRRYAKIARALGNRTSRQVASRLQKYFQKLHAAGLPVPGRIPRSSRSYVSSVKKHRITKQSIRPTTFFPSNFVPVNITDDDGTLGPDFYRNSCENNDENSNFVSQQDDEDESDKVIVDEPSDSETSTDVTKEMAMMHLLKRVKRDKEKRYPIELLLSVHDGYKVIFVLCFRLIFLHFIQFLPFSAIYVTKTQYQVLVGIVHHVEMMLQIFVLIV